VHTRHIATTIATTIALTVPLGCSDQDDESQAQHFCDELTSVQDEFAALDQTSPDQLGQTVDTLDDIDPPDDIAPAYNNVLDVYRTIADGGSLTEPANANKFADIQNDISAIAQYTADNCTGAQTEP
jgi:hypothetical protein